MPANYTEADDISREVDILKRRLVSVSAGRDDAEKALGMLRVAVGLGIAGMEEFQHHDRDHGDEGVGGGGGGGGGGDGGYGGGMSLSLEEEAEKLRVMARDDPEKTKAAAAAALDLAVKESARNDAERLKRLVDAELKAESAAEKVSEAALGAERAAEEAHVRAQKQHDRAVAAEDAVSEAKTEIASLKKRLAEALEDVDNTASRLQTYANELQIAKETAHAAKNAAENARAEKATLVSQLQTFRESAAAKFSNDNAETASREKTSSEEIARLKEQLSALRGEADERVLAERSRVAALMVTQRADVEKAGARRLFTHNHTFFALNLRALDREGNACFFFNWWVNDETDE